MVRTQTAHQEAYEAAADKLSDIASGSQRLEEMAPLDASGRLATVQEGSDNDDDGDDSDGGGGGDGNRLVNAPPPGIVTPASQGRDESREAAKAAE